MKNATDFLIDISDKMDKKMEILKGVVMDGIIPNMEFSEPFGMRTFLSVAKSPIIINSLDMGKNLREEFVKKIQNLPFPNGGAPIAEAFKESAAGFRKFEAEKGALTRRIVFVTNGEDTDSGVLDYEVEKVVKDYPIQVNIIGICMSESNQRTAQKVAEMTGGAFCNIEQSSDIASLRAELTPIIDALHNKAVAKVETPVVKVEPVKEEPAKVEPVKVEAAPAQPAVSTAVKVEMPVIEKVESPVVDKAKEEARQSQIAAIKAQAGNAVKADMSAVEEANATIVALLEQNKNMVAQLMEARQTDKSTLDMLMNTISEDEAIIQELRDVNAKLSTQNQELQQLVNEQSASIDSLVAEKESLQKEIDRLLGIANEMLK